jgi:N-acyl-D-aspartate/D-glutamate deacylase
VVGNCGHGCAPVTNPDIARTNTYGYHPSVSFTWRDTAGYLARLEDARPAVNMATLVPNGNLRLAAGVTEDRPATPDQLRVMESWLEEGLEAGAFGYSTGLEYPLERSATEEELVTLCRVVARHGALYATHARERTADALPAIEEQVRVAERARVSLQVSHITPRIGAPEGAWETALKIIDAARERGCDAAFDMHTRLFGVSNLCGVIPLKDLYLPREQLAKRLRDPAARKEMRQHRTWLATFESLGWNRVRLYTSKLHREAVGRSFAELVDTRGDPADVVFDILLDEVDDIEFPLFVIDAYEEDWLRGTYRHPLCSLGSDSTALGLDGPLADQQFPGAFTWAAWYFRRIIRETRDLSLEDGIRRLTSLPSDRLGLDGRGRLAPGNWADVTILDPDRFQDRGTLENPKQVADGVVHVLVNGRLALTQGRLTNERHGVVLRRAKKP